MTENDIYKIFVGSLIDTYEWRTEHPELANVYVDGLLDMCVAMENKLDEINKDGDDNGEI